MALHADKNLCPGVNPHLNSFLQQRNGGWKSFHTAHLMHIFEALDALLPDGYYAQPEASLQIGIYDPEIDVTFKSSGGTIADVLISRSMATGGVSASTGETSTPTLTLPIPQMIEEEDELTSVLIYSSEAGKPVTRIELLSPSNKPPGSHYGAYLTKREETLRGGLRLVEIDYLHERRPVISGIPSYSDRQQAAYPYHIMVSDPRPTPVDGKVDVYSFGVLDKLPTINIPLDGQDTVRLDFGELYHQTFGKRPFRRLVDYTQEPVNFETYIEVDRDQIGQWMMQIANGQSN